MMVSNWSPCMIRSWISPVVEDVFVEDIDAHDVADDVGRAVMVAPNPDDPEVVAVGVAANDLQAGEMPLREPLEVEIVEDIAIDHQLAAVLDRPGQELFEKLRLADVAAQVQITDHDAIVDDPLVRTRVRLRRCPSRDSRSHSRPARGTSSSGSFLLARSKTHCVTHFIAWPPGCHLIHQIFKVHQTNQSIGRVSKRMPRSSHSAGEHHVSSRSRFPRWLGGGCQRQLDRPA